MLNKLKELQQSPQLLDLKTRYPIANDIIVILAIIMFWRGVWGLFDEFFFPNSPIFSHLLTTVLGIVILYLNDFKIDNLKR